MTDQRHDEIIGAVNDDDIINKHQKIYHISVLFVDKERGVTFAGVKTILQ